MSNSLDVPNSKEVVESTYTDEWNIPARVFQIKSGNKLLARAEAKIISGPEPLIFLYGMGVDPEHMSQRLSVKLMDSVESFIKKENKLGLLYDQILGPKSHRVYGMYERRGWQRVPKRSSLMHFNAGPDAPLDQLSYIYDQGIEPMYYKGERHLVWIS